jgi:hypothetical protein
MLKKPTKYIVLGETLFALTHLSTPIGRNYLLAQIVWPYAQPNHIPRVSIQIGFHLFTNMR